VTFNNNKTSCKSGGVLIFEAARAQKLSRWLGTNLRGGLSKGEFYLQHFLPILKTRYKEWDILFQYKLGNNDKTLGQITPLWLFFSPDEWHVRCISNNNRKGKLCQHYKHNNLKHHVPAVKLSRFHLMNCQTRLGL